MSKDFDPTAFLDKTDHFDPDKFAGSSTPKSLGDVLKEKGNNLASGISEAISSITPSAETLKDFGLAAAQGATLGGMDELVGGIAAASEVPSVITGKRSLSDLANIYRQYQQLAQKEVEEAEKRSPTATTVGGLTGAFVPGVLTAGLGTGASSIAEGATAAKRIASAAKQGAALGAISGGLTSKEGGLTSLEEAQKLGLDVTGGALAGGALGAGTQAILGEAIPSAYSKAKEYINKKIEDKPFFRQMRAAKELGEKGINVGSSEDITGAYGRKESLLGRDTDVAHSIQKKLFAVDESLGAEVGTALQTAQSNGEKVVLSPEFKSKLNGVLGVIKDSNVLEPYQKKELFDIVNHYDNLSPIKTKGFIDSLDNILTNLSGDTSQAGNQMKGVLSKIRKEINTSMKDSLPGYKLATDRFERFRSGLLEPLVSGGIPSDISDVFLGNLKNKEADVFKSIKGLVQKGTKTGTTGKQDAEILNNFFKNLRNIDGISPNISATAEDKALSVIQKGPLKEKIEKEFGMSIDEFEKNFLKRADESAMLQHVWGTNPQESFGEAVKKGALDKASTGRGIGMSLANTYGRIERGISQSKPAEFARNLASAPFEKLEEYANKLIQSGDKGAIGTGEFLLKAIQEKNSVSKNAAIFKIMQDPKMRLLVSGEDLENKPNE